MDMTNSFKILFTRTEVQWAKHGANDYALFQTEDRGMCNKLVLCVRQDAPPAGHN